MRKLRRAVDWFFNPCKPRIAYLLLLYSFIFVFYAVLRPPFQSPDEWSHFGRVAMLFNRIWWADTNMVNIGSTGMTSLYGSEKLGKIPFDRSRKLSNIEIYQLKKTPKVVSESEQEKTNRPCDREWTRVTTSRIMEQSEFCRCTVTESGNKYKCGYFSTSAWAYPPIYYLITAQFLALFGRLFERPYEIFYAVRISSSVTSAGLWALALVVLSRSFPVTPALCFGVAAIPMLAFMSSAVNPDAFLYPFVVLCVGYFFNASRGAQTNSWLAYTLSLGLALLCKVTAIFIVVPLTIIVTLFCHANRKMIGQYTVATVTSLLLAILFFYGLNGGLKIGSGEGVDITLLNYVFNPRTYASVYQSFWGSLGWLDVAVSSWMYDVLWCMVLVSNIGALKLFSSSDESKIFNKQLLFGWVIFVGHSMAFFAAEYLNMKNLGWMSQGRYLLPAALFLLIGPLSKKSILGISFAAFLFVFNLALINETVHRYFEQGWSGWWTSIPWLT